SSDSHKNPQVFPTRRASDLDGTCAGTYSETRTWHATDACGNTSGTVQQTITVRDITPPFISEAGANATIDCPASPTFTAPTASNSCDHTTVLQSRTDSVAHR